MTKHCLILNLSPRKSGTSAMLGGLCRDALVHVGATVDYFDLYARRSDLTPLLDAARAADTLVLSGCCYINTYPAHTTWLLQSLAQSKALQGQNLYGIIQGGMPYTHTHQSGLRMLEQFARQTGLRYCGGFVLGLGAMLDGKPLQSLPNGKKAQRQFDLFLQHIIAGEASPDAVFEAAQMRFPRFFAKILISRMNRMIDHSYADLGHDASAPSPYLNDPLR